MVAINWLRQPGFMLIMRALCKANLMLCWFTATNFPSSSFSSACGDWAIKVMTFSFNASFAVSVAASVTAFSAQCSLRERNCANEYRQWRHLAPFFPSLKASLLALYFLRVASLAH